MDSKVSGDRVVVDIHTKADSDEDSDASLQDPDFLSAIVNFSAEAIITIDVHGKVAQFNPAAEQLFGYALDEVSGKNIRMLMPEPDATAHDGYLQRYRDTGVRHILGHRREVIGRHKSGEPIPLELGVREFWVAGKRMFTGAVRDLTAIKAAEAGLMEKTRELGQLNKRLERLSLYDSLTGLVNRTLFFDRLDNVWAAASRNQMNFAVLMIDLDHFKPVNDTYGHEAGDRILKETAKRLKGVLRVSDTIARIGGDEFAAILPRVHDPEVAQVTVQRMLDAVSHPIPVGVNEIVVGMSVGIAFGPDEYPDSRSLMADADAAMYTAKRNNIGFQIAGQATPAGKNEALGAVASQVPLEEDWGEVELYFQPVIDISTGEITAIEGLLRPAYNSDPALAPHDILQGARTQNAMSSLTQDVIRKGADAAQRWHAAGHNIPLSLNMNARQMERVQLGYAFSDVLENAGLSPKDMAFEFSELEFDERPDRFIDMFYRLRQEGFGIAIDHFGTGSTNFGGMADIPANQYKLDKSLIKNLDANPVERAVVHSMANLAGNLGIRFVAVGVEHISVCRRLWEAGCSVMQGFLFAKPMTSDEIMDWIEDWPQAFARIKSQLDDRALVETPSVQ